MFELMVVQGALLGEDFSPDLFMQRAVAPSIPAVFTPRGAKSTYCGPLSGKLRDDYTDGRNRRQGYRSWIKIDRSHPDACI